MVTPIHYGDVVGLLHPGSNARIDVKSNYVQFVFTGGVGLIQNNQVVTLAPKVAAEYSLLKSCDTWTIKLQQQSLYSGSAITLEAPGREPQQYQVFKLKLDPVEHVVLLMLENRSFFRVFGYMDPNRDNYVNYSEDGKAYYASPTDDRDTPDPPHEIEFVNISTANSKPEGFVKSYHKYHQHIGTKITEEDSKDIMGYTRKGFLPTLHKMEEIGSVCTQWYSSVSGPTWPNRMFALSGTSFNWRTTPEMNAQALPSLTSYLKEWYLFKPPAPQRGSIFDIFKEKKVSYKVYSDNVAEFSLSWLFYPSTVDADDMDDFYENAKQGKLPHFSFIEPNYIPSSLLGWIQNDDHPPADPIDAQDFISKVYEALRNSPKWNNTLFIVTYDEHGGFFDPVIPPSAPAPDEVSKDAEGTFAKFGLRVPTILLSPCVNKGLDNTVYDHTSVLKYMLEKWAPESVGHLGERVKAANTLPVLQAPRKDPLAPITEKDVSRGKLLRTFTALGSVPEPLAKITKKKPLSEAASISLRDPGVVQQLKAILVEKSLSKKTPEELASIAVAGLSLGGVVNAGAVTLGAATSAAHAIVSAEQYAEVLVSKCAQNVTQAFATKAKATVGAVLSVVQGVGKHVEVDDEAVQIVATQLRAATLFAQKYIGDNSLALVCLAAIREHAEERARAMLSKGKEI